MGLWIDDALTESPRWLNLTPEAKATLIELWSYCYRAGNDGMLTNRRLPRASDTYTPEALSELVAEKWVHQGPTGCGTDTCPPGLDGHVVMHDFVQWQESAAGKRDRIERSKRKREEHAEKMREWREAKARKAREASRDASQTESL